MDLGSCENSDDHQFLEKDPTGRFVRSDEILGGGVVKTAYRAFDEVDGVEVAWKQVNVEHVSPKQLAREIDH
jgi:WNK lysine deficient protein kinase